MEKKIGIDIANYFTTAFFASKESKLRVLHFKIVHHLYPTNILLQKMRVKERQNCDHCNEIETLEHLFYNCPGLSDYWSYISKLVSHLLGKTIKLNLTNAMFGLIPGDFEATTKKINLSNQTILLAKLCITLGRNDKGKILESSLSFEKV